MEAVSDFVSGMMLDCFDLFEASKNITVLDDKYKSVLIRLAYRDDSQRGFNIMAALTINPGGQISKERSIKVVGKYYDQDKVMTTESLKSFSPAEVTDELMAAVKDIEDLFDSADLEDKRLFM